MFSADGTFTTGLSVVTAVTRAHQSKLDHLINHLLMTRGFSPSLPSVREALVMSESGFSASGTGIPDGDPVSPSSRSFGLTVVVVDPLSSLVDALFPISLSSSPDSVADGDIVLIFDSPDCIVEDAGSSDGSSRASGVELMSSVVTEGKGELLESSSGPEKVEEGADVVVGESG